MRTKLRKVGNSRGIILPAPFLKALRLDQDVEVRLVGDQIILEAPSVLREGWYKAYQAGKDVSEWDAVGELSVEEDWEW